MLFTSLSCFLIFFASIHLSCDANKKERSIDNQRFDRARTHLHKSQHDEIEVGRISQHHTHKSFRYNCFESKNREAQSKLYKKKEVCRIIKPHWFLENVGNKPTSRIKIKQIDKKNAHHNFVWLESTSNNKIQDDGSKNRRKFPSSSKDSPNIPVVSLHSAYANLNFIKNKPIITSLSPRKNENSWRRKDEDVKITTEKLKGYFFKSISIRKRSVAINKSNGTGQWLHPAGNEINNKIHWLGNHDTTSLEKHSLRIGANKNKTRNKKKIPDDRIKKTWFLTENDNPLISRFSPTGQNSAAKNKIRNKKKIPDDRMKKTWFLTENDNPLISRFSSTGQNSDSDQEKPLVRNESEITNLTQKTSHTNRFKVVWLKRLDRNRKEKNPFDLFWSGKAKTPANKIRRIWFEKNSRKIPVSPILLEPVKSPVPVNRNKKNSFTEKAFLLKKKLHGKDKDHHNLTKHLVWLGKLEKPPVVARRKKNLTDKDEVLPLDKLKVTWFLNEKENKKPSVVRNLPWKDDRAKPLADAKPDENTKDHRNLTGNLVSINHRRNQLVPSRYRRNNNNLPDKLKILPRDGIKSSWFLTKDDKTPTTRYLSALKLNGLNNYYNRRLLTSNNLPATGYKNVTPSIRFYGFGETQTNQKRLKSGYANHSKTPSLNISYKNKWDSVKSGSKHKTKNIESRIQPIWLGKRKKGHNVANNIFSQPDTVTSVNKSAEVPNYTIPTLNFL